MTEPIRVSIQDIKDQMGPELWEEFIDHLGDSIADKIINEHYIE